MRNHAVRPRPRPGNSLPNPRGAYLGEDSATSPGHEQRREELGGIPPHRRRQHTTTTKGPTTQKTRLQNRQTEISLRNQRPRTGHPQTNFEMKVHLLVKVMHSQCQEAAVRQEIGHKQLEQQRINKGARPTLKKTDPRTMTSAILEFIPHRVQAILSLPSTELTPEKLPQLPRITGIDNET